MVWFVVIGVVGALEGAAVLFALGRAERRGDRRAR